MMKDGVVGNIKNMGEENHEDLFVIQSRKENRNVFIFFLIFISHPLCLLAACLL